MRPPSSLRSMGGVGTRLLNAQSQDPNRTNTQPNAHVQPLTWTPFSSARTPPGPQMSQRLHHRGPLVDGPGGLTPRPTRPWSAAPSSRQNGFLTLGPRARRLSGTAHVTPRTDSDPRPPHPGQESQDLQSCLLTLSLQCPTRLFLELPKFPGDASSHCRSPRFPDKRPSRPYGL